MESSGTFALRVAERLAIRISAMTFALICATAAGVRADRVVLTNGKAVEGQIVDQTADQVKIKCQVTRTITTVKSIPTDQISRIEKSAAKPVDAIPGADEPATSPSPVEASTLESLLDAAVESWRRKDYRAASTSMTRLIRSGSLDALNALSKESMTKLNMDVARLAASSRLASALDGNTGTNIDLKNVTDYETQTLVAMLDQAIEEALVFDPVEHEDDGGYLAYLLDQVRKVDWGLRTPGKGEADDQAHIDEVLAEQNPPLKGPSPGGQTSKQIIAVLLDHPAEYHADPEAAKRMARHVQTTASLIHEKTKYDWDLRKDREAQKRMARMRIALGELSKRARDLAAGRGNGRKQPGAAIADRDNNRNPLQRPDAAEQADSAKEARKAEHRDRNSAAGRFNPSKSSRSPSPSPR